MVKSGYRIAISGLANSGKNTLAKIISKQLILSRPCILAQYLAFADPIKEMARIMFPTLPRKFFFGSSKWRNEIIPGAFKNGVPLTVRQLLLDLGTAVGRGYKVNIWLDNFDARLKKVSESPLVIITDTRFRNEFDHLKKLGFQQIRVYRDVGTKDVKHPSETLQAEIEDQEFDFVLHNDGSLAELKQLVAKKIVPFLKP